MIYNLGDNATRSRDLTRSRAMKFSAMYSCSEPVKGRAYKPGKIKGKLWKTVLSSLGNIPLIEMLYAVRCLKSNDDMILALTGQFKQLSHEPEKLR